MKLINCHTTVFGQINVDIQLNGKYVMCSKVSQNHDWKIEWTEKSLTHAEMNSIMTYLNSF